MRRLSLRFLVVVAAAAAVLFAAVPSHAQTITLPSVMQRRQPLRPTNQQPFWVNRADCLADDMLSFAVVLTGYQQLNLQVWAGTTDCTQVNQRQAGGSATCWLVYSNSFTNNRPIITIPARNIVAQNTPDSSGESGKTVGNVVPGTIADCDRGAGGVSQQLALYFMFVGDTSNIVGQPSVWKNIGYDISAPLAPTGLSAEGGETRIHLTWTSSEQSDILLYNFYCDPPPGVFGDAGVTSSQNARIGSVGLAQEAGTGTLNTGGTSIFGAGGFNPVGAGGALNIGGGFNFGGGFTTGAGGVEGVVGGVDSGFAGSSGTDASTSQQNCLSKSAIVEGADPAAPGSPLGQFLCGSVTGKTATRGTVEHLVNGITYGVAVSAVDIVGNVGKLSVNQCAAPQEVTDFFELYRQAGGQGGGGFCSMSHRGTPSPWALIALGAVVGVAVHRRRKRS